MTTATAHHLPRPHRSSAALLAAGALGAGGLERWARGTRATRDERRRPAVTIHAPSTAVWPWLVQMGCPAHRAGWYIPQWIDRLVFGIRTRIHRTPVGPKALVRAGFTIGDVVQAGAMLNGIWSPVENMHTTEKEAVA